MDDDGIAPLLAPPAEAPGADTARQLLPDRSVGVLVRLCTIVKRHGSRPIPASEWRELSKDEQRDVTKIRSAWGFDTTDQEAAPVPPKNKVLAAVLVLMFATVFATTEPSAWAHRHMCAGQGAAIL